MHEAADGQLRAEDLSWVLLSFDGRINRRQYVVASAIVILVTIAGVSGIDGLHSLLGDTNTGALGRAVVLVSRAALLALGAKRAHDLDQTGWLAIVMLLPVVRVAAMVAFALLPGSTGRNSFGTQPVGFVPGRPAYMSAGSPTD